VISKPPRGNLVHCAIETNNADNSEIARALNDAVDAEFYRYSGTVPEGVSAAEHYATIGWREGRDPNPWFSTTAYISENPAVGEAGIVPLFHYLTIGHAEGRQARASTRAAQFYGARSGHTSNAQAEPRRPSANPPEDERLARDWQVVKHEFDAAYYLTMNPDVERAGIDPLHHFLEAGWREGRDPNYFFSVNGYLSIHSDVACAGMNPFVHYVLTGRKEGRALEKKPGFRYGVIKKQIFITENMRPQPSPPGWKISSSGRLTAAMRERARNGFRRLALSFSHDDYTENVGGLQACVAREADEFESAGIDQLHFFPASPRLTTERENDDPVTGVLVNGRFAGWFRAGEIARTLEAELPPEGAPRTIVVHSLLGHNARAAVAIARAAKIRDGYFWIHDYASACAGLHLLRNDVEFCGAPPSESTACEICTYGARRKVQVADHRYLFERLAMTAIAPSRSAMRIWTTATNLPVVDRHVLPHCRLVPSTLGNASHSPQTAERGRRLRIAFLGMPMGHKGWPVFREAVKRFGRDRRYEFFHLGKFPEKGMPVRFEKVAASFCNHDAMTKAVEKSDIDVAVVWSLWPETFCFTAYEAIAGGAAVIAPQSSGNVADLLAQSPELGCVFEDETALFSALERGDLDDYARSSRKAERYSLEFSRMTAGLMVAGVAP
jgi:hypothetical protein